MPKESTIIAIKEGNFSEANVANENFPLEFVLTDFDNTLEAVFCFFLQWQ